MRKFKNLFFIPIFSLFVMLSACDSSVKESTKVCPQCHMPLPKSNINTSFIKGNAVAEYFDDVGCMVLWIKENNIDTQSVDIKVFSNDTKKYIDATKAFYRFDEKTPMRYGFSAYAKNQKNTISFDEVIIKMLRGEHMANPKIRKQILGY